MSSYTQIEPDVVPRDALPTGNMVTDTGAEASSNPEQWTWVQKLKQSSHPVALLFYIFFRLAPIFVYLFGNFFIGFVIQKNRFILHFITLILLNSADFWNLKNIAGRLLVGLRWWNEINQIDQTGEFENVWVFETANPDRYINSIDSKVFWLLLYIQPAVWVILGILAVLKFEFLYLILIFITVSLSLTNCIAFTRCDKFGKANAVASSLFSSATSNVFSRFNPFQRS